MSFLFPMFLLGALSVAIPIVLHFVARHRAPQLPFSDVRFLERALVRRDGRRRLRELLLLALRVAVLLLLALAFARPFVDAAGDAQPIAALVVDRSLSMSAPGQMARGRERAREVVAGLPRDWMVAVVAFADRAAVVQEPTPSRAAARAAIDAMEPTPGATRYAAGLAAAVELIAGRRGRIVVVTDLQAAGWRDVRAAIPPGVAVEVAAVEPVPRNLAVTAVGADAEGIAAVVLNAGSTPREAEVTLAMDGREIARRARVLAPGANDVRWDTPALPVRVAAVTVADAGGYRWDDTRYFLPGPEDPTRVALVVNGGTLDTDAFYVAQALEAAPESRPFAVRPVAPGAVAALDAATGGEGDVIVIAGTDGLSRPGRARIAAFVGAGGGLLVAVGPGVDPRLIRDVLGAAGDVSATAAVEAPEGDGPRRLAVVDPRHPIFRPFGRLAAALGQVRFTRTAPVTPPAPGAGPAGARGGARVLATFDHGDPALIEYDAAPGRALVFASDLHNVWNDFPRRSAFVPFLHEAVRYLAGSRTAPRHVTPAEAPAGVPPEPGVATAPGSGRRVAVNVDPRESEPAPMTADEFLARLAEAPAGGPGAPGAVTAATREAEQSLWWYALIAMAMALAGEAWLGRSMA